MGKDDGGSAFPCQQGETSEGTWNQTFQSGMTLRDYFAAHAPAEPADWFRCDPLPGRPIRPTGDGLPERVVKVACDGERNLHPPLTDEEKSQVASFRAEREAYFAAEKAWNAADLRNSWIAWRWAYADAMLAARSK